MQDTLIIAKALADSNRMRVLAVLMGHEELCVCQITALLNLATATVSRHMSVLHGAGLVQSRKQGRWVYYRLSDTFPALLREWLEYSLRGSAQVDADRAAVAQVLACDPNELCRCQRPRGSTG
jgi:ArsR family transcriptional regulator, arsenate/arsenite/antimonite-responsive transcriptional repressor